MDNDIIICRCQEVTRQEILDAIADGAVTVDGVKRRTRAGENLPAAGGQADCGADRQAHGGNPSSHQQNAGPPGENRNHRRGQG